MENFISSIPDDCLVIVFSFLKNTYRNNCSMVCRHWHKIDNQSRRRLTLDAGEPLILIIPKIFGRFKAITDLTLKCDPNSKSITNETLTLITSNFPNLATLKLRGCRSITNVGISAVARHCRSLCKLSILYCSVGEKGIAAVIQGCLLLEELSIKVVNNVHKHNVDWTTVCSSSLQYLSLKSYDVGLFQPLILVCPNLKTLKLNNFAMLLDPLLGNISDRVRGIEEIHLEEIFFSDIGLAAITEKCQLLRKIHIAGHCGLITHPRSLKLIASNCRNLESLSVSKISNFRDTQIACIASNFIALKKFSIEDCPVSDHGMEALADGCPNLVQVKVKNCINITLECVNRLMENREGTLTVYLDNEG